MSSSATHRRRRTLSSIGISSSRWRWSAASIRPANSGCGRSAASGAPGAPGWRRSTGAPRGQLDELHQVLSGRGAGEHQSGGLELLAVGVVDLVAVPVALVDLGRAVRRRARRCRRRARPGRGPAAWCRRGRPRRRRRRAARPSSRSPARGSRGRTRWTRPCRGPPPVRAYSITMHCRPRHRPSVGILCVRAYVSAPSLPSMPRMPNPPGTQIASTSASRRAAPSGVSHSSEGIHSMLTFASWAKPPARSASTTER